MARIIRAVAGHPGIPEGLPILVSERMAIIEPAFSYLLEVATIPGRSHAAQTVRTYAEHLHDWFDSLEQSGLEWQTIGEATIAARLGPPQHTDGWLSYEIDALAGTPNLLFTYPSALAQAGGYIAKQVKLEFGALTDQQPTGTHGVAALLAQTPGVDLASAYDDLQANVVALEITRTFWEKATILHAEHHRPPELPIRDRFARHYADFEALWRHQTRAEALSRLDLLEDVVRHKSRFFSSGWTHYETAKPGTFRFVPPPARHAALARDYATMAPMFIGVPIEFDVMLQRLQTAEQQLNDGSLHRPA